METCKINLSNLEIGGRIQVEDVEAIVSFIFTEGQKEIIRDWEDSQEFIPDSIEIYSVIPCAPIWFRDDEGVYEYVSGRHDMLYLLTDEQIEDIIDAVYENVE